MMRRKTALTLAVASLLLLAGCATGDGTPTTTDSPSPTPAPSAAEIAEETISTMDAVKTYWVNATQSITVEANLQQQIDMRRNVSVNRTSRRVYVRLWQSSLAGTTTSDTYLVNGSLYQRSQIYAQRYASEWIKIDVSGNVSEQLQNRDALAQQRRVLNVTTLRLNGTETVRGVETYRLETTDVPGIEEAALEQLSQLGLGLNESTYTLEDGSYTFWISTETHLPVRVSGHLNSTLSIGGQQMELRQSFVFRYDYEASVSIDLPEAARNAVPLSEALNASGG